VLQYESDLRNGRNIVLLHLKGIMLFWIRRVWRVKLQKCQSVKKNSPRFMSPLEMRKMEKRFGREVIDGTWMRSTDSTLSPFDLLVEADPLLLWGQSRCGSPLCRPSLLSWGRTPRYKQQVFRDGVSDYCSAGCCPAGIVPGCVLLTWCHAECLQGWRRGTQSTVFARTNRHTRLTSVPLLLIFD
jgi:hypothetical protein